MKMTAVRILLACLLLPVVARGGGASASYTLDPVALDGGGGAGASSNYTANFSASPGGAASSSSYTGRFGFAGQLSDPVAIVVAAVPTTVDEGATRQLGATLHYDDATTSPLEGGSVGWSVSSGPLTGISTTGLAQAGAVYEDTVAVAQGVYLTFADTVDLTVLDTDPDNFGTYAADGIADAWQVNFFGAPPNAEAAPGANPDGDFHDNLMEFLTGYDPTDGGDFFRFAVTALAGSTATIELSKIIPGTRYRVERSEDLDRADPWTEITNFTTGAEVTGHQLLDPASDGVHEFYRIGVEAAP